MEGWVLEHRPVIIQGKGRKARRGEITQALQQPVPQAGQ